MSAEQVIDSLINDQISRCNEAQDGITPAGVNGNSRADPLREELAAIQSRITEAEDKLDQASKARTSALAFGIPLLILFYVLLAINEDKLFGYAPDLREVLRFETLRFLSLWAVATLLAVPIYYFIFRKRYITAKDDLQREQRAYIALRLSTEAGRRQYFREELFRLTSIAARVFFGDQQRFAVASRLAETAGSILDGTKAANLGVVQSCLNSLDELVGREEREQKEERSWQNWAIAVMFLYVGVLIVSAVLTNNNPALLKAAVFGVPLSVIIWGAAGSLAAILYRFYTEQGQIRFAAEFRWLIARPIIGIVMGAVVYLALYSGLVLVSPAPADNTRMEAFWIIAFLAGFSDKFYLSVIDLLVARTVRTQEIDSNTVITQKERIHDGSSVDQPGEDQALPKAENS
jgi:hypothetical protein